MATPLALVFDLIAKDAASPVFNRVAVSADRAAVATDRASVAGAGFGKKMAAAFAGLAVLDIGVHAVKAAADFQRAMLLIQTQAGASAAEVKTMTAAVLQMAPSVAQGPEALATSLYHIESVGLRGAKALNVLKIAAEGAKVGNANLEETTNALTSTVASGIPGVRNMQQAMGALNAIVGAGDMKLSDLNEALGSGILTVVKGYGLSLRDVGAALATFGDNNIRGAEAATMLRMSVQAMAVPAKAGRSELARLGLTAKTLSLDMQQGGLNKAILDLKSHLDGAHVGAKQVGATLTEIFGKRAGPGLAVLIGQVSRFEQKLAEVDKGSKNFGDQWDATQKTASFAFDKLKVQLETFGISMGTKLLPVVTAAANWLGTNIPRAAHELSAALMPVVHLVGSALVGAWHGLLAVLGPVAGALGNVTHFLNQHGVLADAATAVLALWAAFKGYAIAVAALRAVNLAVLSMRRNLMLAGESGRLGAAGLAAFAVAVYAAGKSISTHLEASNSFAKIADHFGSSVDSLTAAMVNNTAASKQLGDEWVRAQIHATGLDVKAAKANISVDDMAAAIESGAGSTDKLAAAWRAAGSPADNTIGTLKLLSLGYGHATTATSKYLDATRSTVVGTIDLTTAYNEQVPAAARADAANRAVGHSVAETGRQLDQAALSGKKLVDALNNIDGGAAATAEAVISFHQGLNGLKDASDKSSRAIFGNSTAALQNRSALLQLLDAAKQHAATLADQGKGAKTVAAALEGDVAAFERTAIKAGYSRAEIRKLEATMHLVPKSVETTILTKTQAAQLALQRLQDFLNNIVNRDWVAHVRATGDISISGQNAAGGTFAGHIATGGTVRGPGTGTSDSVPAWLSNGEEVINAKQANKHRSLLKAINAGVGGFASGGTVGDQITTGTLGGKKIWIYGGKDYASLLGASNAYAAAHKHKDVYQSSGKSYATLVGAVNHAITLRDAKIRLDVKVDTKDLPRFSKAIEGTVDQAKAAFASLYSDAVSAGGSKSLLAYLRHENTLLDQQINVRNGIRDRLKAVQQSMVALSSSVKSGVTGSFAIGSAGANPVTGAVTGRGIVAQQRQALTRIKHFASGIKRLIARHLNHDYLAALAAQGPDAIPQIDALLSLPPNLLGDVNRNATAINAVGASVGSRVATDIYGSTAATLKVQEKAADKRAERTAHLIAKALTEAVDKYADRPEVVKVNGKTLLEITRKASKEAAR